MKEFKNHSIAILGGGESGMGALRLAAKYGLKSFLSDAGNIPDPVKTEIKNLGYEFEEGYHTLDVLIQYDEIVKSPGIPDSAQIILDLLSKGKSVISEIEFASHFTEAKIIGITGSNGKTTTTLLTTHLLKSGELKASSAGNVGNSFSDLLVNENPDVIVLELSSFQLDGITDFRPDVAILLNITPDHLDRYGYDLNQYADAKLRLLKNMMDVDRLIYNVDDALVSSKIETASILSDKIQITTKSKTNNGAYFLESYLIFEREKSIQIISIEDLPLLGRHNQYNQMAAVLTALEFDVDFYQIMKGLKTFEKAPHRMEEIANIGGLTYINDSKATNVDAVFYALEAYEPSIIWIAGGVNKGNDYAQIKALVRNKVKALICLGTDNKHLLDEFSGDVNEIYEVSSAHDAVNKAHEIAKDSDTVLLSPACASFDLFSNYEDRGDQFRDEVLKLKNIKDSVKA